MTKKTCIESEGHSRFLVMVHHLRDQFLQLQPIVMASGVPLLCLYIGFFYRSAWHFQDEIFYFGIISSMFFLLLVAYAVLGIRWKGAMQSDTQDHSTQPIQAEFVFAVMAVVLVMDFYIFSDWMEPLPWPLLAALVIGSGCIVGLRMSWDFAWQALAAVGVVYFAAIVVVQPIDIEKADMLPLVRMGIEGFLDGFTPYAPRSGDIGTFILEFHYLPGLWLSYLPTVALGIDMRVYNLLALTVILALVFLQFGTNQDRRMLGLTLLPIIFSPVVVPLVAHGHVWPFWLGTVAFGVVLLQGRILSAALILGLLLATRQMALFIAAPVGIYILSRLKFSESLRFGALSISIFFSLIIPFWVVSPDFLTGTYLGFETKGLAHIAEMGNPLNQISFAGLLYHLDLYELSRPIQFIILLGFCGLIVRDRSMDTGRLLRYSGLVYLLLIGFNPFVYPYHYVSGLLLLAIGFAKPQLPGVHQDLWLEPKQFSSRVRDVDFEMGHVSSSVGSAVTSLADGKR